MNRKTVLLGLAAMAVLVAGCATGGSDLQPTEENHLDNLVRMDRIGDYGVYKFVDVGNVCYVIIDEANGTISAQGGAAIDCLR